MDWLDLARYADTYGYQADVDRDMSPYRDWVIRAFNDNLPYDQFLTWQLAGDLLPDATRDQRIATAFNRLHRQTNEGGSVEEEFRTEYVADRVNTFGTAMLGPDARVRPLPRPQVRSDHAARLLLAVRVLQQHRRVRTVLALHQRDADAGAAARGRPDSDEHARSDRGAHRRNRAAADGARAAARGRSSTWIAHAPPLSAAGAGRPSGVRRGRRRHDAGSRRPRDAGTAAGRSTARPGAGRARTARCGSAATTASCTRARRRFGRTDPFSLVDPADADRGAAARGRPAPVARLDRRRQPRLRADARPWPAVLRADPLLARQRDRGPRQRARCR